MAHFAKIEDGHVVDVIVVNDEDCGGGEFPQSEPIGRDFIRGIGMDGEWVQTSYNGAFRSRFAGIGMIFDGVRFFDKKPPDCPSFVLNEDGVWVHPVSYPTDGKSYKWNEADIRWDESL